MSRPEFKFIAHRCPHCKAINQLSHPKEQIPDPGSGVVIVCPNIECQKPYYLSWLGPWDMDESTQEGAARAEREKRFAQRMLDSGKN